MAHLDLVEDFQGRATGGVNFCAAADRVSVFLAANVEKIVAVPTGKNKCLFSADSDFFVRPDGTIEIPTSGVDKTTTAGDLNPVLRHVTGVTDLHLIAGADTLVSMSFYD